MKRKSKSSLPTSKSSTLIDPKETRGFKHFYEYKFQKPLCISRNKTTKICHRTPTVLSPDIPVPDDVWFHVFCFLHDKDAGSSSSQSCKSSNILEVLRPLFYASKEMNGILIRYAQNIPQNFIYNKADLEGLAWVTKHNMKLGLLSLNDGGNSYHKASACQHLLKCCNIRDLHTLKFDMRWFKERDPRLTEVIMVRAGIPREILSTYRPSNQKTVWPRSDLQLKELVDYLTDNVKELKSLCITVYKARFYTPILNHFSDSLEELSITFMEGGALKSLDIDGVLPGTYSNDFDVITCAIERMPKLRKLTIRSYVQGTLNIRSKSLEKIDVRRCGREYFWIPRCVCPSLKMLITVYGINDNKKSCVKPVVRFTNTQLLEKWQDPNRIIGIEFKVKEHAFVGLKAPDSCIVRLYTL